MLHKNVIVFGSGKTGKSQLSRVLQEKLDCNTQETKNMLKSISKVFPSDSEMTCEEFETKYLIEYIRRLSSGPDFFANKKNIIEINTSNIDEIIQNIDYERNVVVGLIHGDITPDDLFKNIKSNETDLDITHYLTDESLKTMINDYLFDDKTITECFNSNNLKCFETSGNREEVFDEISNEILNNSNSLVLK